MDKSALLAAVSAVLESELDAARRGASAASEAATDPDSRAENKYDTRALESSYLARGQSLRVAELVDALAAWRAMATSMPAATERVGPGSLVRLVFPDGEGDYLIGPASGGSEVRHGGRTVTLLTSASPLGRQLAGLRAGEPVPGRSGWRVSAVF